MSSHTILVENRKDWQPHFPEANIIEAKEYIANPEYLKSKHEKVINLCRSYRYLSLGEQRAIIAEAQIAIAEAEIDGLLVLGFEVFGIGDVFLRLNDVRLGKMRLPVFAILHQYRMARHWTSRSSSYVRFCLFVRVVLRAGTADFCAVFSKIRLGAFCASTRLFKISTDFCPALP